MRAVWAEIDLNAVAHNVKEIKKFIGPDVEIMAIIKANGYSHGARAVSFAIEHHVDAFGVAILKEAVMLREQGIQKPILVMGYTDEMEYHGLLENDIIQTIFTLEQGIALNQVALRMERKAKVHLKIETGMNRLGFSDNEKTLKDIDYLNSLEGLEITGIFSHMADGGKCDNSYSYKQLDRYLDFVEKAEAILGRKVKKHVANSATLVEIPEARLDMVRPGIMLYGCFSTAHPNTKEIHLKKPLTLKGKIVQIREVAPGEPISYDGTFVTERATRVAVLPIGYGDGIFRGLSNKASFYLNGKKVPIIGNVCMDQLMLDITDVPDVKVKDEVIVYGEESPVEDFAQILGTISYEVLCAISERVPKVYVRK